MKKIQKLFPRAITAVERFLRNQQETNMVAAEYKGYAASFGPSVITAGLLPTLAFYTDSSRGVTRQEPRRYHILEAICYTAEIASEEIEPNTLLNEVRQLAVSNDYSIDRTQLLILQKKIINASIAVKLALRSLEQIPQAT
ncbi:MAG: type III-B CRISPR module-associated protein Cmr5 [Bacteroidota bacterium]